MSNPNEPVRVDPSALRGWELPDPGASKKSRGRVCVVGGSVHSPGAVLLAGEAALRVGAGLATLYVPEELAVPAGVAFPEAGVYATPQDGTIGDRAADHLAAAQAVLVGPGLDDPDITRAQVTAIAAATRAPLLLDAFALGILPDLDRTALGDDLVLTPNREEVALLLNRDAGDDVTDVREVAHRYRATVSCYGGVAAPDGRTWAVPGGGPGLGTSGSGDALSGAIAGFLARGVEPGEAAVWGTWVHTRAGNRLTARAGLGFLARDLVRELPAALAEVAAG